MIAKIIALIGSMLTGWFVLGSFKTRENITKIVLLLIIFSLTIGVVAVVLTILFSPILANFYESKATTISELTRGSVATSFVGNIAGLVLRKIVDWIRENLS